MNVSGQALLWCPVQVTVLALAALGIEAIIGRRRPAAGALVAALALIAVVGLTATAFSPWPSWPMTWDRLPWRHATEPSNVAGRRLGAGRRDRGCRRFESPTTARATARLPNDRRSLRSRRAPSWNGLGRRSQATGRCLPPLCISSESADGRSDQLGAGRRARLPPQLASARRSAACRTRLTPSASSSAAIETSTCARVRH